ncbi:ccr4-not transcription complex [Culex quinquefasciatus]|uniref:Ccr4-not transcription complex n=1 Tax=Culex quinquefasciatus TaxID=7176 RepID=B0X2E7_CULQU|nr:ccr4-not transcription complex [Culex quinquefasciatus]|eukprot:XP_001863819.1 ccr4-not transcription complex [Culex quinquefasciatus]
MGVCKPSQSSQEGSLNELLQHILSLLSHGKQNEFGLANSTYTRFVQQVCRDFPREHAPVVLTPLLYPMESEVSAESLLRSSAMDTACCWRTTKRSSTRRTERESSSASGVRKVQGPEEGPIRSGHPSGAARV